MKSIDTLITDIQGLFDGAVFDPARLADFSVKIGQKFSERFEGYSEEGRKTLRLSNVGRPLRQLWFDLMSEDSGEVLPPDAKLKFLYGDILEAFALFLAVEAGHTVSAMQEEVSVDGVVGHIDCDIDGWLVDVKSASTQSFQKFKTGTILHDDPFGYIGQLCGYATARGTDRAAFLVIDKQLGHLTLFKLTPEQISEYDVKSRIRRARAILDDKLPPSAKCYPTKPDGITKDNPFGNGSEILSTGCNYCRHKHKCWADANDGTGLRTFLYSTGPKHFTRIARGKTPRVTEITRKKDGRNATNNSPGETTVGPGWTANTNVNE